MNTEDNRFPATPGLPQAVQRATLPKLPIMAKKNLSTMRDPRRTIVMVLRHSPKGRCWYRVAEACEFENGYFLHRDYVEVEGAIDGARQHTSRSEAVKAAKGHATATGNPYERGLFEGYYGRPLAKFAY